MEYRDYYATLGVPRGATQAEIKKAFRKLARQHHPDVNKGDAAAEKRFKEVSEANEVLSDPEKRKLYDQLGANWQGYQGAGAGSGQPGNPFADYQNFGSAGPGVRYEFRGNSEDLGGFSDFFRTFFGGEGATSFGSAAAGTRTQSRARATSIEDLLAGLGGEVLDSDGRGSSQRPRSRARLDAQADVSLEEVADGARRLLDIDGRRLEVKIPPGVADGQRIRFSGIGPDGGDVYLNVKVRPHAVFTRKGNNLYGEVPVTLREALLGAEVRVPTLGGRVLLRIPPETQNGRTFRLAGKGLPKFRGDERGDLYTKVRVVLPTALTEEATEAAKKFLDLVDQPDPR